MDCTREDWWKEDQIVVCWYSFGESNIGLNIVTVEVEKGPRSWLKILLASFPNTCFLHSIKLKTDTRNAWGTHLCVLFILQDVMSGERLRVDPEFLRWQNMSDTDRGGWVGRQINLKRKGGLKDRCDHRIFGLECILKLSYLLSSLG